MTSNSTKAFSDDEVLKMLQQSRELREHQDTQILQLQVELKEVQVKYALLKKTFETRKEFIREQDDKIAELEKELESQSVSMDLLKAQAKAFQYERHAISNRLINSLGLFGHFKLGSSTPNPDEVLEVISKLVKDSRYRFQKVADGSFKARFADENENDKGWVVFMDSHDMREYARSRRYHVTEIEDL